MRQPGGLGTEVIWKEPKEYVESMFGFKRYFTLENKICKVLFDLAQNVPENWRKLKLKVRRRDRDQTASGATQSALYAAAFALQAANMRAGMNHKIQSTGATSTKRVQRRIWDIQPPGINEWIVQPFNSHDELLTPVHPDYVQDVTDAVNSTVEELKETIPLLKIDWSEGIDSWASK